MDIAGAGSLISSLVGLGTKIGTAVPGLRRVKKRSDAEDAARSATRRSEAAALSLSQRGMGPSRGLALREGLRAVSAAAEGGATAQARGAQADQAAFIRERDARNARVAEFGTDLAKGLGDMAAAQITPKGGDSDEAALYEQPGTGVAESPYAEDDSAGLGDIEKGLVDQDRIEYDQEIAAAGDALDDFRAKREEAGVGVDPGGPKAAFQVDPTTRLIESMPPRLAPEIEQQLADKLHMQELALAEAERLGINLEVAIPRMQRRLQLQPGQSMQNPMGHMQTDFDDTGVR